MRKSKTRTLLFGYIGQESVEEHEVLEYEEGENDPREFTPESSQEKPFCLSSNRTNDGLLFFTPARGDVYVRWCGIFFILLGGTSNNLH